MRSRFDEQLALLNKEMIEMGALCEEVIALASKALTEADPELAKKVAPLDAEIDQKERNIESLCLKLLLQQQPVARDLRQISAALKMITDMERIGDRPRTLRRSSSFSPDVRRKMTICCAKWPARPSIWSQKVLTLTFSVIQCWQRRSLPRTMSWTTPSTRSSAG